MTKKSNWVWLCAVLWLVLGCQNEEKPIVEASLIPKTSKSTESATTTQKNQNGPDSANVYTKAAIETCNCMSPMVEKAKSYNYLEMNHQVTDMQKVANEMALLQPQIQKCSDEIRRKYGQINNRIEEKKVLDALIAQCPNVKILFSYLEKLPNK